MRKVTLEKKRKKALKERRNETIYEKIGNNH